MRTIDTHCNCCSKATVTSGSPALPAETRRSLLEKQKFSLVLLDLMMPDLNGDQVLKLIKSDPEKRAGSDKNVSKSAKPRRIPPQRPPQPGLLAGRVQRPRSKAFHRQKRDFDARSGRSGLLPVCAVTARSFQAVPEGLTPAWCAAYRSISNGKRKGVYLDASVAIPVAMKGNLFYFNALPMRRAEQRIRSEQNDRTKRTIGTTQNARRTTTSGLAPTRGVPWRPLKKMEVAVRRRGRR